MASALQNLRNKLELEQNNHQLTSQKLQYCAHNLNNAKQQLTHLKSAAIIISPPLNSSISARDGSFVCAIETSARRLYPGCIKKTKATKVYRLLQHRELFDSKTDIEQTQYKEQLLSSREIYRPWKLRKKCDIADQGGLNISGCG